MCVAVIGTMLGPNRLVRAVSDRRAQEGDYKRINQIWAGQRRRVTADDFFVCPRRTGLAQQRHGFAHCEQCVWIEYDERLAGEWSNPFSSKDVVSPSAASHSKRFGFSASINVFRRS